MKISRYLAVMFLSALSLAACERKGFVVEAPPAEPVARPQPTARTKTLETTKLGKTIDVFESAPTAEHQADVKKALADLDGEIAELQGRVARVTGADRDEAAIKLRNLQSYRDAETLRFTKAQAAAGLGASPAPRIDPRTGAEKVEDSAKKAGSAIKDAAQKTGDAIKDAVR